MAKDRITKFDEELEERLAKVENIRELEDFCFEFFSVYAPCMMAHGKVGTIDEAYNHFRKSVSYIRAKIITTREFAFPSPENRDVIKDIYKSLSQFSEIYVDLLD